MTYSLRLSDEDMRKIRVALNIRAVQRAENPDPALIRLSDRLNKLTPDTEENAND